MAIDFPASPSTGQSHPGPGMVFWKWDGSKWVGVVLSDPSTGGGGISDAPSDNIGYGRRNALWTPVLMLSNDILDGGNF